MTIDAGVFMNCIIGPPAHRLYGASGEAITSHRRMGPIRRSHFADNGVRKEPAG